MSHSFRTFIAATACALAVGLTACAVGPSTAQKKDKDAVAKGKVVCVRDAPTGSHITQMVCYKQQDVTDRRKNDKERVRNLQIGGAINPKNPNH